MRESIVLIEAPSNLGLKPPKPGVEPGVRRLPEALTAAGLPEKLGARKVDRIAAPPYRPDVDPDTNVRNAPAIAGYAVALADRVRSALERREFPLVLGGDCSILLGSLLALAPRGRHALFFVDGHGDFETPATSPSHAAAGMDLALATGRGPALLSNLEGRGPLVRDEDVVVLGYRDGEVLPGKIAAYTVDRLRSVGIGPAVRREASRLRRVGVDAGWIHVDADVLDPSVMPAVDTPEPGGLAFAELTALLRALMASGLPVGMQLCIYDPDRDPDGLSARGLVDAVAAAFDARCRAA